MLMSQYTDYLSHIGPFKKFKTKAMMFKCMSENILQGLKQNYSDIKCINREKTIVRRQNEAIKNNKKSGSSRKSIPYAEEREKLNAIDHSVDPEVLAGVGVFEETKKRPVVESDGSEMEGTRKKKSEKLSNQQLSQLLLENMEQNRMDRRERQKRQEKEHNEKMDLLRALLSRKDD